MFSGGGAAAAAASGGRACVALGLVGDTALPVHEIRREQRLSNGILSVPGQLIVTVLELVGGAPGEDVPLPEILVCHCCASSQKVS